MIMTEENTKQKALRAIKSAVYQAFNSNSLTGIDRLISRKNEPDFIRAIEEREEMLNNAREREDRKHENIMAHLQKAIKAEEERHLTERYKIGCDFIKLKDIRKDITKIIEQQNTRLEPPVNPQGAYWDPNPKPLGPMNPEDYDFI